MSDTPETDDAQFGTGRVTVDFARRLERQRDAYAETLDAIAYGRYCGGVTTFIYTRHPELAQEASQP